MKRFALAGNPNSGKTTLFNRLTGSTAHVGNWPGVTVEKKTGTYKKLAEPIEIVDLPGIYSLSPYTPEEVVSRNYIIDEKPDVVINIVDATNLERNLYLTTQLLEINVPVVVALNMNDVVLKNGDMLDDAALEKKLGVPVVNISALKGDGLEDLMYKALEASSKAREGKTIIENKDLSHLIKDVTIAFKGKGVDNPLFHAVKLVELDELEVKAHSDLVPMVEEFKETFNDETFGNDFEALIADERYSYIAKNYSTAYVHKESNEGKEKVTKSDKIDKVLTHRIWAIPLFIVIMFFVFHFTFSEDLFFIGKLGALFSGTPFDDYELITNEFWVRFFSGDTTTPIEELGALNGIPSLGVWIQSWFGWVTGSFIDLVRGWFVSGGAVVLDEAGEIVSQTWYASLLCDGILNGLDAVLSFIPQIGLLFLFIAILEDSGYMARIAFILDRAFRRFGLSGKAFIPMLTGFGCSVPAIMATRTLEDEREKNRTIRLITCFSCGAKAPIWALLAAVGTWIGWGGDLFVFSIYLGGIALAVILAIFMTLFSKDQYVSPFIMELPAYHLPQVRNVFVRVWERLKHYVVRAGTVLVAALILIWFLSNFGWAFWNGLVDMEESMLADLGRVFSYVFYPLGWAQGADGWKYSVASLTGLVAKEDVVGTMASLGLVEDTIALDAAGVYAFAAFNLFTLPCFAAIAAAKGEQKGKEFAITMAFWFLLSYGTSLVIYWVGELYIFAWWLGLIVTLLAAGAVVAAGILVSKRNKEKAMLNA